MAQWASIEPARHSRRHWPMPCWSIRAVHLCSRCNSGLGRPVKVSAMCVYSCAWDTVVTPSAPEKGLHLNTHAWPEVWPA